MEEVGNPSSRLPPAVSEALAGGALILTPNHRIARNLRQAFDQQMQRRQHVDWSPPEIFAAESWLSETWHRLTLSGKVSRVLLNRTQELALWRKILSADSEVSALRSLDALAELAATAWRQLWAYNGRLRPGSAGTNTDSQAFARWCEELQQILSRSAYITVPELPSALRTLAPPSELLIGTTSILLTDFDVLPPALKDLLASLGRSGYQVTELTTTIPTASMHICEAATERTELENAATWARQILDRNPQSKIAIIVPKLADRRSDLIRIFGQTLAPGLERFPAAAETFQVSPAASPLELSLGTPLCDAPAIRTGLDLLRWSLEPIPVNLIGELLLSPFFGSLTTGTDPLVIAEFDTVELRQHSMLRPELSLQNLIRLMEASPRRVRLATLLSQLKSLQHTAQRELPEPGHRQSHAEWSDLFALLLQASGWTSTAQNDSLAFQRHRRFEAALDELGTLDFDGSRVTATEAMESLNRILRQAVFAPESHNAPVQIMGPLELGGVPFDALWFLGAGDLGWPATPVSSPLIPNDLKRTLGLPGSSAERHNAATSALTARIAASAREVVFSYAAEVEGSFQHASPILRTLHLQPLPPLASSPTRMAGVMDIFADTTSIPPLPDRITSGGAQILQAQSACGFRAFAEHRLWSTQLESRAPGLDDLERGNLVHRVMEHFWSKITTQAELAASAPMEREFLLQESIGLALERTRAFAQGRWDEAYLLIQQKRLANLLRPWLEQELSRPPFTVRSQEKRLHDVCLGPLRLTLRVDRIDETEAGTLILDYKTGRANPSEWKTDRPDAPQLPLYAVLSGEAVNGVAFALLRAGNDLGLKGFADSRDLFGPTSRMDLPMQLQVDTWRRDLTSLAIAFDRGDPRPDPKTYPTTCSRCTQRLVCRLDPATLRPFDEDEELLAEEEFSFG